MDNAPIWPCSFIGPEHLFRPPIHWERPIPGLEDLTADDRLHLLPGESAGEGRVSTRPYNPTTHGFHTGGRIDPDGYKRLLSITLEWRRKDSPLQTGAWGRGPVNVRTTLRSEITPEEAERLTRYFGRVYPAVQELRERFRQNMGIQQVGTPPTNTKKVENTAKKKPVDEEF